MTHDVTLAVPCRLWIQFCWKYLAKWTLLLTVSVSS
jgi:hypothetical protein